MSLDVYLSVPGQPKEGSGIFVRECGETRQISREEWDERFPGCEPVVLTDNPEPVPTTEHVFERNITHNLGRMAAAAELYDALWQPSELGLTKAAQLIEPLRAGIAKLDAEPARFKAFNPVNGWGSYEGLLAFAVAYLAACEEYPDADVRASR